MWAGVVCRGLCVSLCDFEAQCCFAFISVCIRVACELHMKLCTWVLCLAGFDCCLSWCMLLVCAVSILVVCDDSLFKTAASVEGADVDGVNQLR